MPLRQILRKKLMLRVLRRRHYFLGGRGRLMGFLGMSVTSMPRAICAQQIDYVLQSNGLAVMPIVPL